MIITESPRIEFLNTDCMLYMKSCKNKAFDLAIVDPIYGILQNSYRERNRSKLAKTKNYHNAIWQQQKPSKDYFAELFRISKNQIIWGGNYFINELYNTNCMIVWDKNNSGNFADCEIAWTSFKSAIRKCKFTWNGMLQENMKEKQIRIHPNEKPIHLYEWILKNYAKPGYKIFDSHLGSASIAIACNNMGFDLVGTEIDEIYYNDSIKRFYLVTSQMKIELNYNTIKTLTA